MRKNSLNFVTTVLTEMNIQVQTVRSPFLWKSDYDYGLRKTLYTCGTDYEDFCRTFQKSMAYFHETYQVYSHTDRFGCEVIMLCLPDDNAPSILRIGPFSYTPFTYDYISALLEQAQIPKRMFDFMNQYYSTLPVITDPKWLKTLLDVLLRELFPDQELSVSHYVGPIELKETYSMDSPPPPNTSFSRLKSNTRTKTSL